MTLTPCTTQQQLDAARELYLAAFPDVERKPFPLLLQKRDEGVAELLAIEEGGAFLGIAFTLLYEDIVLLDYFAVCPARRGQGIGSRVLTLLQQRHGGCRLLLEIEDPDEPCDNPEERLRRRAFYLRNGMTAMPYRVWLFGVKMQILTAGEPVAYEEYHRLFEVLFSPAAAARVILAE